MILKRNIYYKKSLNPNELLYIKIRNECTFFIYMRLNYTVNGKRFSKQSPVFGTNKSKLLTFPSGALHVCFRIFNCLFNPPELIYNKVVVNYQSTCYKISGPAVGHINCIEVPC